MTSMQEHVQDAYRARPCFVCGVRSDCRHREYHVEVAYILAEIDSLARLKAPPASARPIEMARRGGAA